VLTPLIGGAAADNYFIAVGATREDEAVGTKLTSRRFDQGGPVLLAAKIDDAPGIGQTVRDPPLIRHRFMRGLGTGRASALDG
jgi:hypothetical protein